MNDRPTSQSVNILCPKWGTHYGPHYVNLLYCAVSRNLDRPFRFFCGTDDASGLNAGVETIPLPGNPGVKRGWPDILIKLVILRDGFGGLQGPTLFLDLDVSITGSIDCFFDYKPGECIIHNWVHWRKAILGRRSKVGNSSVFRFESGKSQYAYDKFLREISGAEVRAIFNTEQVFLTYALGNPRWWPDVWVKSYKWRCRKAAGFGFSMVAPTRMKPYRYIRAAGSTAARFQPPGLQITGIFNPLWLKIDSKFSKGLALPAFDFQCERA